MPRKCLELKCWVEWSSWWDLGRVPANYGRLPNANGGQAFTCCPPSLGPSGRHQGRQGLPSPLPPPALTGITFGARTSSLMIRAVPEEKGFSAPLARFAGLVGCGALVGAPWRVMQHAGHSPLGNNSIIARQLFLLQLLQHLDKCSISLNPTALKHDEVGRLTIGSTDQSRGW